MRQKNSRKKTQVPRQKAYLLNKKRNRISRRSRKANRKAA